MSMKRNLDTEVSEKYWGFVQRVAERVSHWPAWKQVQFRTVIGESSGEQSRLKERSDENLPGQTEMIKRHVA